MKTQRFLANTVGGKHAKAVALTVTLCAAGMSTSAHAQTVGAVRPYRKAVTHLAHATRPAFHVRSSHVPDFGAAKIARVVVGLGGGCGSSPAGFSPACWQSLGL